MEPPPSPRPAPLPMPAPITIRLITDNHPPGPSPMPQIPLPKPHPSPNPPNGNASKPHPLPPPATSSPRPPLVDVTKDHFYRAWDGFTLKRLRNNHGNHPDPEPKPNGPDDQGAGEIEAGGSVGQEGLEPKSRSKNKGIASLDGVSV